MLKYRDILVVFLALIGFMSKAQQLDAPDVKCISVLSNGDVLITWDQVSDPNTVFQNYNIYGQAGLAGTVGNITTTTATIIGANANVASRNFYLQSIASPSGLSSGSSLVLNSIFLQVNNPGNGTAWLTWNPISTPKLPGASDYYYIWKEYPIGTWNIIDSTQYGSESYFDTITICGDQINYRISTSNGNCISESNIDGGFFQDLIAPAIPDVEWVEVDTSNNNGLINWQPSSSQDTEAYIVFYFDGSGWILLDTVWGYNNTMYTHVGAGADNQSINYGIAAFDSCWTGGSPNTSALGLDHSTIFLEGVEDICSYGIDLEWNAYENWPSGVLYYEVLGSENNQPFVSYGTTSNLNMSLVGLTPNSTYCFVLKAYSNNGLTSLSNKICRVIDSPVLPTIGYLSTATVEGDQIRVKYLGDQAASLQAIQIERSDQITGPYTVVGTTGIGGPITEFIDTQVNPSHQSYFYRVVAIDSCGNLSIISNIAQTILTEIEVDQDYFKNTIFWTPYQVWDGGVQAYELYRSVNGIYETVPIAVLNPAANVYQDDVSQLIETQGEFCYQIRAVEQVNSLGMQELSYSNEVCAQLDPLVYIPNAIVVDGINNIFKPSLGYIDFNDYLMHIYDRWGQLIFESKDVNLGWNGTSPSGEHIIGTYIYHITYRNSKGDFQDRKGSVTVVK